MMKTRTKRYKPTSLTIGISLGMLILAVGMVEGATTIWQILIALAIGAAFGSIVLVGER